MGWIGKSFNGDDERNKSLPPHREYAEWIAELCEFPDAVTSAIEYAGQPGSSPLAQAMATSDRVACRFA